ncbi:MAG: glycosyl transferase [Chitinophagaceae bacterium]|nr:MAG: glycosyl transferase [Chitinophagaceae bacterium]
MSIAGKIFYKLYHQPIQVVRSTLKTGLRRTVHINAGRKQMMQAAMDLNEVCYSDDITHRVYFLTGKKYWFQTAFCLYSLQLNAGVNIHATILDDGSFDDELERKVKRQFPTTVDIVRNSELVNYLDEKLPVTQFPVLRQRRIDYPHLRKLTDVHVLPGAEPKLVLDSDMLFFQQPHEMLNWLQNPKGFLFMRDVTQSYGYTLDLMKQLTGAAAMPDRLNVGVAGVVSSCIDWPKLEFWTEELLRREGSSYLQEQALTAMLAANVPYKFLNEADYKVCPSINSTTIPEILHHYVADSKYDYFVKGWPFFFSK